MAKTIQQFDPTLNMPDMPLQVSDRDHAVKAIMETVAYWEGMVGSELGDSHVTVNVDNTTESMTYYMVIHYHETDTYSVDLHHYLPTYLEVNDDDVRQCRGCGSIHADNKVPHHNNPVHRQSLDGHSILCDYCADNELRYNYELTTGDMSERGYFGWLMGQRGPTAIGM